MLSANSHHEFVIQTLDGVLDDLSFLESFFRIANNCNNHETELLCSLPALASMLDRLYGQVREVSESLKTTKENV